MWKWRTRRKRFKIIPEKEVLHYRLLKIEMSPERDWYIIVHSKNTMYLSKDKLFYNYNYQFFTSTIKCKRKINPPWYDSADLYYFSLNDKRKEVIYTYRRAGNAWEVEYNKIFRYIKNVEK